MDTISTTNTTDSLGLSLDSSLSWKILIEHLSSKLNSACYLIRLLRSVISRKNLRTTYFSYVHSIMVYGIIFCGSSPLCNIIFKLQKRTIRIMMNVNNRQLCRDLFKKLSILPLYSQYTLSLSLFVVKNIDKFKSNSETHSINTHHRIDLFLPAAKLSKYQKQLTTQEYKFFNTYLRVINAYQAMLKSLKQRWKNSFYWVHSINWMNILIGILEAILVFWHNTM